MFNAISKPVTTVALSMLLLCSCGNSDKEGASQLFTQTEEAIQNRNYTGALTLLDTLNARYPKQLDIRKAALRLRASAMEGIAIDSIGAGDMALAQATIEVDRLRPQFRHVESSVGLEGYFLPNKVSEKVMTATGIQARVSDKGYFYMTAISLAALCRPSAAHRSSVKSTSACLPPPATNWLIYQHPNRSNEHTSHIPCHRGRRFYRL